MRISIDVRHLASDPVTGVGVVTYELIDALASVSEEDSLEMFYNGHGPVPTKLVEAQEKNERVSLTVRRMPNRLFDVAAPLRLLPSVQHHMEHADVHLSPHMLPLPPLRIPRVLILHDLSFVRHPEFFSPRSRMWHARMHPRRQAKQAAAIIAPSYATARDVIELWGVHKDRVHVIPWGTPRLHVSQKIHRATDDIPTLLFLGTVERRKNPVVLIRALHMLQRKWGSRAPRLVLMGAFGWGSEDVERAVRSLPQPEAVEMVGYVNEQKKAELLSRADIFLYPSLYEGSGLPVLEAMASGIPVIVSKRTALPEVVGPAAMLVDPNRPDEIAQSIALLLEDKKLYVRYQHAGIARARECTWEKTALGVRRVLKSVCE